MSVIGRLDEQVDDVLIAPLNKRTRQHSAPGTTQAEPVKDSAEAPSPAETPAATDDRITGDVARGRDELPVWLL
jgi:hypothetical protein